jgi:hypothetical protein
MPSRPSSPNPSDSSEEVILFHGRNKPATVTLPATAVNTSKRRVKYTEPQLPLTASTMPNLPASAVTIPATAVISSDEDAERQFQRKVDKYRQEMRAQARSGAPPTIVNP